MDKAKAVFKMLFPEKCWHDREGPVKHGMSSCSQCGYAGKGWPDLTTWQGFGLMWERAQGCEWWGEFHLNIMDKLRGYINPTRFMDALYDFGVETGRIK